jgi:hypothetical protein
MRSSSSHPQLINNCWAAKLSRTVQEKIMGDISFNYSCPNVKLMLYSGGLLKKKIGH